MKYLRKLWVLVGFWIYKECDNEILKKKKLKRSREQTGGDSWGRDQWCRELGQTVKGKEFGQRCLRVSE